MKHGGLERDEKVGIKRSKENLGETKPDSVNMNSFIRQQSILITRNVATNITPTESSKQSSTKCSNWQRKGWDAFLLLQGSTLITSLQIPCLVNKLCVMGPVMVGAKLDPSIEFELHLVLFVLLDGFYYKQKGIEDRIRNSGWHQ